MNQENNISILKLFSYSFLALPIAFVGMPLYIYAPDFYASQHGLSLSTIGFVLIFIRLFDAVQDPVIGMLSDRHPKARGLFMGGAILMMGVSFFLLFHPVEAYITFWFALTMLCLTTSFSVISINLNTLGGIWTTDTNDKTKITAAREFFGLIGVVLAAGLPAFFMRNNSPEVSFYLTSLVLVSMLLISGLFFMWWLFSFKPEKESSKKYSILRSLKKIWSSVSLRRFYFIYGISMLASAIPAIMIIFFVRDRLGAEEYLGGFLMIYFLSGIIAMPVWYKFAKYKGKAISWAIGMLLAVMSFVWAYFLGLGDVGPFFVICAVSGIALGAELALPPAILSDLIDENQSHSQATIQFSIQAFLAKSSLALATGFVLPSLEKLGYTSSQSQECCTDVVYEALSIFYAVIPCLIKCIALSLLWRWYKEGEINAVQKNNSNDRSRTHV
jgi:Na+/melibiose symporter-like transporter